MKYSLGTTGLALAAATMTTAPALAEANFSEAPQCVLSRQINDFEVLDRAHIVLIDRAEENFYVGHISARCWSLQDAYRIEMTSRMNQVCEGSRVRLRAQDVMGRAEYCSVSLRHRFDSLEEAERHVNPYDADESMAR